MQTLTVLSPAKINLYLNVIGKRPDGYHQIETVMERISLCDRLVVSLSKKPGLELLCSEPALIPNNTIARAFEHLKVFLPKRKGLRVFLHKRIPVGSGLGGASSNAAFFILGFLRLLRRRLPLQELYRIGANVGSDVNFFLSGASYAFCTGRGEEIVPWEIKHRYTHYIIFPELFCSTASVYAAFRHRLTSNFNNVNILYNGLKNKDLPLIENGLFNALRAPAQKVLPRLEHVGGALEEMSIRLFNLTGSGSAFFIIKDRSVPEKKLFHLCRTRAWRVYRAVTF